MFLVLALVMGMQAVVANGMTGASSAGTSGAEVPSTHVKEGYMISGHVIEKSTEENIPFATVLIVGTDKGTMSNEAGQFQFKELAEGS